jgi:probable 2-oxoglutarate dehydrogenase E1 component DHKTD1
LVSGKVFYELDKEREARGLKDQIAIVRIEELCPFPFKDLVDVAKKYGRREWMWVQEEPMNQGAYGHVRSRMQDVLARGFDGEIPKLKYVGRKEDAVPAVGNAQLHKRQWANVLTETFQG